MKTAVDTSALLTIFNGEAGAEEWVEVLIKARKEGLLLYCEVVYTELAPAFETQHQLELALEHLGLRFDPITNETAWVAGKRFRAYRQAGGPREHLVPDFLIAAHAAVQADRLAAVDRGYYRTYFPNLTLVKL